MGVEIGREDARILKDGAVLDNDVVLPGDIHDILEALVEEVDLEVERPARHVGVEVIEIGVELDGFEVGLPSIVAGKQGGECGLPAPDISSDDDVHVMCVLVSPQR